MFLRYGSRFLNSWFLLSTISLARFKRLFNNDTPTLTLSSTAIDELFFRIGASASASLSHSISEESSVVKPGGSVSFPVIAFIVFNICEVSYSSLFITSAISSLRQSIAARRLSTSLSVNLRFPFLHSSKTLSMQCETLTMLFKLKKPAVPFILCTERNRSFIASISGFSVSTFRSPASRLLIWPVASSIKEGINSTFSIIRLSLYNCLFLLYAFSLN